MTDIMGLIGVAAHYYTNFIGTLLLYPQDRFSLIIGTIMNNPRARAGHCYIFTGKPGTGKTTIMNILRWTFENDSAVIFVEDYDPNKIQVDPSKIYFIATNLPKEQIDIPKTERGIPRATVIETSGARFPRDIYKTYMYDFERHIDCYKLICNSAYQIWHATKGEDKRGEKFQRRFYEQ